MSSFLRLAAVIAVLTGVFIFSTRAHSEPAPAWTLKNLHGKSVSLSDFKGKVVVLNFWAPWCPPCREEIPSFIDLQNQYKAKGVTFIGMAISAPESDVASFVKDHGMNYPIVMGDDSSAVAYGADQGIPITAVIDRKGNVVATHLGGIDKNTLEGEIQKALAK